MVAFGHGKVDQEQELHSEIAELRESHVLWYESSTCYVCMILTTLDIFLSITGSRNRVVMDIYWNIWSFLIKQL